MNLLEIINGNKLISEFMGLNHGWAFHKDDEKRYRHPYSIHVPQGYVKYYDDWNWLMAAVDKIESLGGIDKSSNSYKHICNPYRIDILGRNIVEVVEFGERSIFFINEDGITKMEAVFKSVIGFIKWYNKSTSIYNVESQKKINP